MEGKNAREKSRTFKRGAKERVNTYRLQQGRLPVIAAREAQELGRAYWFQAPRSHFRADRSELESRVGVRLATEVCGRARDPE
jgi:hypothetical protein